MKKDSQNILVLVGSTYVCEQTFSAIKFKKSRYIFYITDDHLSAVPRIVTSGIQTDFNPLFQSKTH